jgi:uncharacterized iron-regulated protein
MKTAKISKTLIKIIILSLTINAALFIGCQEQSQYRQPADAYNPDSRAIVQYQSSFPPVTAPRALPMFTTSNASRITWPQLLDAVTWADVILIGENHSDPTSADICIALLNDIKRADPNTIMSLEMLARDAQPHINSYLNGQISANQLIEKIDTSPWATPTRWRLKYQALIDAALYNNFPVLASNTPPRITEIVKRNGIETLMLIDGPEKKLFKYPDIARTDEYIKKHLNFTTAAENLPDTGGTNPYQQNYNDNQQTQQTIDPNYKPSDTTEYLDQAPRHLSAHSSLLLRAVNCQMLTDATMADSIINALTPAPPTDPNIIPNPNAPPTAKLIHFTGSYHIDSRTGLYKTLKIQKPYYKILSIIIEPRDTLTITSADRPRADIIIYSPAK